MVTQFSGLCCLAPDSKPVSFVKPFGTEQNNGYSPVTVIILLDTETKREERFLVTKSKATKKGVVDGELTFTDAASVLQYTRGLTGYHVKSSK